MVRNVVHRIILQNTYKILILFQIFVLYTRTHRDLKCKFYFECRSAKNLPIQNSNFVIIRNLGRLILSIFLTKHFGALHCKLHKTMNV